MHKAETNLPTGTSAPPSEIQLSLTESALVLWDHLSAIVREHLHLASLEAQRAAQALLKMALGVLLVAILLILGWIALSAAGVFWMMEMGQSPAIGLIAVGATNLVLALIIWWRVNKRSADLGFSASLRMLAREGLQNKIPKEQK